jgi:hypothetical protein
VDTWEAQKKIMIDQSQILCILKTGLQSTVEIVPKVALLKFLKIYIVCYIFFEILNVFVLEIGIGDPADHKTNKYKK